eukprot:8480470-Alexandrium_andersonii.AAC.1
MCPWQRSSILSVRAGPSSEGLRRAECPHLPWTRAPRSRHARTFGPRRRLLSLRPAKETAF